MNPGPVQIIPPAVIRRPGRGQAMMLPQARLWGYTGVGLTVVVGVAALTASLGGEKWNHLERWLAGAFFLLISLTILCSLARRLPLQNVGAVLLVGWATAFVVLALGVKSGFLFGRLEYAPDFGPKLVGSVPWQLPFLWLAMVLVSRETARVMLRPWRRERRYGYWLLGISALLVLWLEAGLQPFATGVAQWWRWENPGRFHWQGVPWVVYPGGLVLALSMLGFVAPWLIAKRPVPTPPDFLPAGVWVLLSCWLLVGNVRHGSWLAALMTVAGVLIVAGLVRRGLAIAAPPASGSGEGTAF